MKPTRTKKNIAYKEYENSNTAYKEYEKIKKYSLERIF